VDIFINVLLVAAAFVLSIILIRKKVNLGLVMLADSVIIALIARMPPGKALEYSIKGVLSNSTIKLGVALFLIMMLENIMRSTGMIRTMVDNLKELTGSNRLAAALLPAALGLLPSPGGARFSCPMVEEVTLDNTDPLNKTFVNHWFRHIWLDGFILYPGVILAAELMQVSVISFFIHLVPFMVINAILGTAFGLLRIKKEIIVRTKPKMQSLKSLFGAMLPIIALIILYILLLNVTPYSLEIASVAVVTALLFIKRYTLKMVLKTAREAFPVKLVIIIIGVMVFKEVLIGSGAIISLSELMKAYGIPAVILFIQLTFICGFTSGLTVSFISLAFPILIPLGLDKSIWAAVLAFAIGSVGVMITPLHLCVVMTADYFNTPLTAVIKKVTIAEIPLLVLSVVALVMIVV
jgi:integral membrane protein (TIGR00529 family)